MEQNSHTIFLVDDEQHVLKAMKRLLRNEKYRLLTISGGHEALELIRKEDIHLIISDFQMPQMNGTDLLA